MCKSNRICRRRKCSSWVQAGHGQQHPACSSLPQYTHLVKNSCRAGDTPTPSPSVVFSCAARSWGVDRSSSRTVCTMRRGAMMPAGVRTLRTGSGVQGVNSWKRGLRHMSLSLLVTKYQHHFQCWCQKAREYARLRVSWSKDSSSSTPSSIPTASGVEFG